MTFSTDSQGTPAVVQRKACFAVERAGRPFSEGHGGLFSAGSELEPQDYLRPSARSTSPSGAPNSSLFSIAYGSFCPTSRLVVNSGRLIYHGLDEAGKIAEMSLRKVVPDSLDRTQPTRSTGGHAPRRGSDRPFPGLSAAPRALRHISEG